MVCLVTNLKRFLLLMVRVIAKLYLGAERIRAAPFHQIMPHESFLMMKDYELF